VIGSLPKPIQNDFDTIVIDLLSRYSVENKSVQKFVKTVAQQVRDINRISRILKPAKTNTGRDLSQNNKDNTGETQKTDKPNFLTRFENLQNTFNKGGLLGVFFEYLKNRQPDAKAKITTPETSKLKQIETPTQETTPLIKPVEQKTEIIEKTVTQLEKLQNEFNNEGLINIVQNIFNLLKNRSVEESSAPTKKFKKDTINPTVTTKTYTTDSQTNKTDVLSLQPQNTNFSTINPTTTQTTNNKSISLNSTNISEGGTQAQAQNVLEDEISVILGGINDEGEKDLKRILKDIFEEIVPVETRKGRGGLGASMTEGDAAVADGGGNFSLLDMIGAGSLLKRGGSLIKKTFGGAKNLIKGAGRGIASLGRGALALGRMPVGTALSGGGGAAGVLGAGAAVAGGELIGGQIGKSIISNEKFSEYWYGDKEAGKKAAEEFGTGIIGATKATWALGSQMIETKKSEAAAEKAEKQLKIKETKLIEKIQQLGYKTKEEFVAARKIGLAPSLKWDSTKNEYIEINNTSTNAKKTINNNQPPPPNTTLKEPSSWPAQNKDVIPLPANVVPTDIEKPLIKLPEVKDALINPDGGLLVSSPKEGSLFQLSKNDGIVAGPTTSLLPKTTKIGSSVPSSITETHITNNNTDKKLLGDIAGNTEKTNKTLNSLSDAIFTLAKVFDSKNMSNNSVLINSGGQVQEYSSTSQIAANNVDSIRNTRKQFLAAIATT